jgi:iron transport multicopper oxidase
MSGYLPNHNMDPNIVGSSTFQQLWKYSGVKTPVTELFLAKPLVYTPDGGSELVITSSEMNIVRIFDGKTGTLINSRQLNQPFLANDASCGDIPNYIGITGTPIIDSATSIM